METELTTLASNNQQLRSQLEAQSQQLASLQRERAAQQEHSNMVADSLRPQLRRLGQEAEQLRAQAVVEASMRKDLEQQNSKVRAL